MPRLRRYAHGRGYYITGHAPEIGFCTWQISQDGLDYLAGHGICRDGDCVTPDDLRELRARRLTWTHGHGPGGLADRPQIRPEIAHLVDDLMQWASPDGSLTRLAEVVCHPGGDRRDLCFSSALLDWLDNLDPAAGLLGLDGLTATAFEDLAAPQLERLAGDPLHGELAARGAIPVLWRLASIVGAVACQLRADPECPEAWRKQTILALVFGRLARRVRSAERAAPVAVRSCLGLRRAPFLCWQVDLQQIVVILPAQLLPENVVQLAWRVESGEAVYPSTRRDDGRRLVEESTSPPLTPARSYAVQAYPLNDPGQALGRWSIAMPPEACPVLFHRDGTLVDVNDPASLLAGEYLALIPPDGEPVLRTRRGVTLVERLLLNPVGWPRWRAWMVRLEPGAELEPYVVSAADHPLSWEAEEAPVLGVDWIEPIPVWLGGIPRIFVSDPRPFSGASLEIAADPGGGNRPWRAFYRIGSQVPWSSVAGRTALDLRACADLARCYGRVQLSCRPLTSFDRPPLTLRFVRLPEAALDYVDDPRGSQSATAVRLRSDLVTHGLERGPDTEILEDPNDPRAVILRSTQPVTSPAVTASLPQGQGEIRVRVSVTRGACLTRDGQFAGWHPLPLEDVDLGRIGPDDQLLLEFHRAPPTEGGRLITQMRGAWPLFVGQSFHLGGRANVFRIDLHRWRDGFGAGADGPVQVRAASGWIDVLVPRRTASVPAAEPDQPMPEAWWQERIAALDRTVEGGDAKTAEALVRDCADPASWESTSAAAADLLPLAVARTTLAMLADAADLRRASDLILPLVGRADLPEAWLLELALSLRIDGPSGPWSFDRMEQIQTRLRNVPGSEAVLAECYYHFARAASGPADACWHSCGELAGRFLEGGGRRNRHRASDAALLRELASLMRGAEAAMDGITEDPLPSHAPWIAAARFASRYLREPWPRPRAVPGLPALPASAPLILRRNDAILLRFLIAQATGDASAEGLWRGLQARGDSQLPYAGLIRARRALYAGYIEGARAEYDGLLKFARTAGPGELLDIIAEERPLG